MTIEYRNVPGNASASGTKLHGQVTPFNSVTVIGDLRGNGFREQLAPGSWNKTLKEQDLVLLWNHNTDEPMARVSAGNLTLRATAKGVQYDAEPVQTQRGQDALKLAAAGVVKGCSFGFTVIRDSWTDDAGNPSDKQRGTNRTIHELRAHEMSVVTFPAYTDTSVNVRSLTVGEEINAAASGPSAVALARGITAVEQSHDRHIRSVMEAHMTDEERAAKASYEDLQTCADCGAKGQYGDHCANCGKPMSKPGKTSASYCTACGSKLTAAQASEHGHSDVAAEDRAAPKPYGDVTYADPKNGKYPVDTEAHAKAAWAYINMPKNAAKYPLNGVTVSEVKERIKSALKKFGVEISEDERTLWEWVSADLEVRDAIDGDDPNAEFYSIWSHGAIADLCNLVDSGWKAQIPDNVVEALNAVKTFRAGLVSKQSGAEPGDGQETAAGGGETPATEFGPAGERSADDERADMEMRAKMARAQARLMSIQLGELA